MIQPGDIISYLEMCKEEGTSLQRGMNYRLRSGFSVILMSVRRGAPYADRIEEDGRVLIYEGHDVPKTKECIAPKKIDQPMCNPGRGVTQNGLFYNAAQNYKNKKSEPELVKVYEKIRSGIWAYGGIFKLIDAWQEDGKGRKVFKFKLEVVGEKYKGLARQKEPDHDRLIPTAIKLEVWKRDKGMCMQCGSKNNLHFDHIIPYSKGGSSLVVENIQLLCARHNIAKKDKIE